MSAIQAASPTLRGVPVLTECSWCHRVRLGGGYLDIGLRSNVHRLTIGGVQHSVRHGICPVCMAVEMSRVVVDSAEVTA